jgi:hypothetical protein
MGQGYVPLLRCNLADLLIRERDKIPCHVLALEKQSLSSGSIVTPFWDKDTSLVTKTVVMPAWDKDKILFHDVRLESSMWEEDKFLSHVLALVYQQQSPRIIVKPLWDNDTFLCYDAVQPISSRWERDKKWVVFRYGVGARVGLGVGATVGTEFSA